MESETPTVDPINSLNLVFIKGSVIFAFSVLASVFALGPVRLYLEWGDKEFPGWDPTISLFIGMIIVALLISYPVLRLWHPRLKREQSKDNRQARSTVWGRCALSLVPILLMYPVTILLLFSARLGMDPAEDVPQSWSELSPLIFQSVLVALSVFMFFLVLFCVFTILHRRTLYIRDSVEDT